MRKAYLLLLNMKKHYAPCLLAMCIMLFASMAAKAQTITGNISGTVTDSSGAAIPGAHVLAKNVTNGMTFKVATSPDGTYDLRFLPVGSYDVTITANGFGGEEYGPFALEIAQNAKVNAQLQIAKVSTTIKVNSNFVPLLNTTNNVAATTFTANAIQNMPLNGRNFSSLTMFLPGAVSTQPSGFSGNNASERNTNQNGQASVNGNRNQTNNYYLDGIEINETMNNLIGYNPSPEALGQVKVISASAPAEYGNVNGGDIIAVTKSGTNQWHGSAYYFVKNWQMDANTWGNKDHVAGQIIPRSHYTQPTFGATLGGPVLKNKLFFFMDYEGFRLPTAGKGSASVPTAAMRQGDFSALSQQLYNNSGNAGGAPVAYANNQIPIVNPAAVYLFQHPELWPLPNTTSTSGLLYNNYTGTTSGFVRNNQGMVRVDWRPDNSDTVSVRWLQGTGTDGTSKAVLPITFPGTSYYPTKGIAINEVHVFTPNLVNEFRAGFTRVRWQQGEPTDTTGDFGLRGNAILGIGAIQPFAGFSGLEFSCGAPGASIAGCNANGGDIPSNIGNPAGGQQLIDNTFQYGDNLTYTIGHHVLAAGVEITRYQQNNYYPGNYGANGYFTYYPAATMNVATNQAGYALADFELNDASFIGRGGLNQNGEISGANGQRQYRTGYFVQDDWTILPNLTLNLGVRYEYDQPIYEVNNKEANLDFATKQIVFAGKDGNSRALYKPTYSNVMPRLGFNYQATSKVVIHGGFGITSYLEGTGANLRLTYNPPYWNETQGNGVLPTAKTAGNFFTVQNGFSAGNSPSLAGSTFRAWYRVKPSVVSEWSLATEYALTNTLSLTAGYLGETGQHLIQAVDYNQLTTPCLINGQPVAGGPGGKICSQIDPAPFANIVGQNGLVVGTTSEGMMNYNALQMSLRQRNYHGLEYTVNYTYSKSLTNSVGFFGVAGIDGPSAYAQNAYNNHAEYGPSGMDVRNSINGNMVYQLPFGHGQMFGGNWNRALDEAAGGWKLAATAVWYQGFPVTINGTDNSETGAQAARPNQYRKLKIVNRSINHWFGTDPSATACTANGVDNGICAYGNTAYGTFGSASPGTERGPGFQQYDLSLYKSFTTYKSQKLTFRADAFNAFNISSYGNPNNGYASSKFGQITSVRSINRQLQLAATYSF